MNKCHDHMMNYQNDQDPPLNDTNMNYMDGCIETLDNRVVAMDTTKANQSDLLTAMADWNVDNATGDVTITLKSGQTVTRHTNLGKIAINVRVIHDPTDPHYQEMEITMPDGTKDYVDFSAFVTQFEFVDSSEIHASVNSDGEVSFSLINGSIAGTKLQPNYLADVTAQANAASGSATTATNKATLAQSYAVGGTGTRAGEDTDNAKYYKEQAAAIVNMSFSGLSDTDFNNLQDGQVAVYNSTSQMWENEDMSAGLLPHVIVISDTGSTVTLTKGAKVVTATETSTGHFEADVDEYGTWTIDSILGGDDAQTTLNVDAVKIYTITDEHFSASITVSYPSGGTCTLSATGETPQAASSSPYTFTVHAATTYTLTATYRGATRTATVVISTTGQTETYSFLVDGATVLTTDDVEIWLDCACLWDKNYTTEAEIIADSEALLALISDNNAVDYMARSTSFRTLICADALAMLYIGADNYCSTALQADNTWDAAITASDYSGLVLNATLTLSHTLKTFATANEAEIVEMICQADRGEIDLYDDAGWRGGQEHSTSISAISASGTGYTVGESQSAHTATIVLSNHGGVELVNSVLDKQGQIRTQCSFEYDWKNCFPTKGYMNSSQSNSGSWDGCARRAWCNYGLRNAVSPYIRAASKQFKTVTAESYSGSTNKTSNDYFALRAEKELFGSQSYSNSTEAAALSQKTLYDSAASRTKLLGDNGSATPWWERSPNYQGAQFFCNLSNAGDARRDYANTAFGIAPFGAF